MQLLARTGFALLLFFIGAPCCSLAVTELPGELPGDLPSLLPEQRRIFPTTLLPLLVDELSCQGKKKASLGQRLLALFGSIGC